MTRSLTRTPFHSSRLVRILSDLAGLEAADPGVAFAEKLALWVDYTDAIALFAVHNPAPASQPAPARARPQAKADLGQDFARMRAALERTITQGRMPPWEAQAVEPEKPLDVTVAYEPYRRYYLTQQRDMQTAVVPLRAKVRAELAKASAALKQLAALDASFEAILGERESRLLAMVPQLLKHRFADLLAAQDPAGHWMARFCQELQTVLLAELDLRLQTTQGLVEALQHEQQTTA